MGFLSDLFGTTDINKTYNASQAAGTSALNSGNAQFQSGITAAAPALNLLTSLTKGDQGDVTQAAQPEIDQITQQFDQIRNMTSMQPRGGGKTTALAEAPFQKSAAIQRTEGDMRTQAASGLGTLASTLAGLGISQEGLGANLEGISSNLAINKPSGLEEINSTANTIANLL